MKTHDREGMMANVFISHRKADVTLAEQLAQEVQTAGHDVWFDDWEINVGDSIVEKINEGLEGAEYLLLCYSASGTSDWVNREWMSTLARQLSGQPVKVLPVRLSGGDLSAILGDVKYTDLVNDWNNGVQDLLKAIK
ncbi:MAG: toll/interleukin-1 receptor domain-containing protein [Candidatus Electrothrix sp. MAN1_4]|nr:toll/interleukin-1 receptor domain-containing protein [Candidatus Electrothrix sp. MAN1_4]